jgi:hypothetical protein
MAVVASVALALVVSRVSLASFNPEEPHDRAPPVRAGAEPSRRLVVIILDGLGFEKARDLPELGRLRARGVFRPLHAHAPTFTAPNVVAMLTGRAPRDSRIRLNGLGVPDRPFETVLDVAHEGGWTVRCHARQFRAFQAIVGAPGGCVHGRISFALDVLVEPTPPGTFDLIHVGEVDDAGHHEGPESASFAERAAHADRLVGRVAASLDPDRDTIVVLSDHGHIPGGGHGGEEREAHRAFFLAAFGAIDRGRELPERPMRDVAATLAQIAGLRPVGHDLGAPMLDVFADGRRPDAREALSAVHSSLCGEWPASELEPACAAGSAVGETSEEELRALGARRDQQFEQIEQRATAWRGALSGVVMLGVSGLALRLVRRPSSLALAVALGTSNLGAYAGVLGALGYRVTLSRVAGTEIFLPHAVSAGVAGLVATAIVARLARALGPVDAALGGAALLLLGAVVALAIYVGADGHALAPSRAAALLFLGAPAFVGSTLAWALAALYGADEPAPS